MTGPWIRRPVVVRATRPYANVDPSQIGDFDEAVLAALIRAAVARYYRTQRRRMLCRRW